MVGLIPINETRYERGKEVSEKSEDCTDVVFVFDWKFSSEPKG